MKKFYLSLCVFVSGASILAIEILGTRTLGPYYGVSLFLWSALIGVTLIALSVGYFIGGRVADRRATFALIGLLLLISGIWVLIIPLIRGPMLIVADNFELRVAVFLTAIILFFPPLVLLGMISPITLRLRATELAIVGRSAGNLYAISTVAGVLSAVGTGFFFIPYFGVTFLTLLIGAALMATGLVAFMIAGNARATRNAATVVIAGGLLALILFVLSSESADGNAIAEIQSPYAELRVEDGIDGRYLFVDGTVHSLADTSTWQSRLEYVAVMEIPRYMFDRPGAALLVGLGGGSLVKSYTFWNWKVDAVEIDPDIVALAYAHFGLAYGETVVYTMDGRRYLKDCTKEYSLILLDAFGSSSIPFHLVSAEAFRVCRERLEPDGVLAINVWAIGWNDRIVRSLAATLRREFTDVLALPIAEPPDRLGNVVLVAANRPLELKREVERDYLDPSYRNGPQYQRVHAWDNRFTPETAGAEIVTDDRNFVDLWSEAINYAARRDLRRLRREQGG